MTLEERLDSIDERLRTNERDTAVIKVAVENHIPTAINTLSEIITEVKGRLNWFLGILIVTLLTTAANLAHRLVVK